MPDNIDQFLAEQKAVEDRRQALIKDLLKQKEDAIAAFDAQLEKLGHRGNSPPEPSQEDGSKIAGHEKAAVLTAGMESAFDAPVHPSVPFYTDDPSRTLFLNVWGTFIRVFRITVIPP